LKIISLLLLGVIFAAVFAAGGNTRKRPPAVAGMFYPDNPDDLTRMVDEHLKEAEVPPIEGQIIALIVPHAGLVYSGRIAAHSYKLLENSGVDKVILCGPSHRHRFDGVSVYGPGIEWSTPLGTVKCNDRLCQEILENDDIFQEVPEAHRQEHCLEVQLPYLQRVLDDFTIVPMVMGRPDMQSVNILAETLSSLDINEHTVLVSSTDWQHYKPAAEGWEYDSVGLDCLENLDPDRLARNLAQGKTEMCGGAPAVAVIKAAMAQGADKVKILKYGDSGDVSGDKSSVVSYVAAVLYRSENDGHNSKTKTSESSEAMELTDQEKARLLEIARRTIESYLKDGTTPEFDVPEKFRQPGAAFVTLNKNERLRGCIGQTRAVQPLYKTISYCAVQAAVADPRFQPVSLYELDDIDIEISVLTPLQKVRSPEEIKVGRDGLMISRGGYRGLLLPQVAAEYGWNRTEFLEQTCRKAGLPPDAYLSDEAEIFRFQAIIFEEH